MSFNYISIQSLDLKHIQSRTKFANKKISSRERDCEPIAVYIYRYIQSSYNICN